MEIVAVIIQALITLITFNRPLSRNAETEDFALLTSHPVRG